MIAQSVSASRGRVAIRVGTWAALCWVTADALGIPNLLGLPFLPTLPLAALLGGAIGWGGAGRVVDLAAGALLATIVVVAFTPILRPAVHRIITTDAIPASGVDAIMVLSAAVSRDSLLSPDGAERLLHGVVLLEQGVSRTIVTSRVRYIGRSGSISSDRDQGRLISLGPDSVRWEVIDSVRTTRDEAVRTAALARAREWAHIVVVTSPMHTRRACAAFRKAGVLVTCVAAPSRAVAVRSLATASDRVAAFGPWLYETVGWWWYRMRGWV